VVIVFRFWARALLDVGHRPGRGGPLLLDVNRQAADLHQLERRRAQQLPLRERRGGALPRAVEQRRQGTQVERHALLLRNLLRLRSQLRREVRTECTAQPNPSDAETKLSVKEISMQPAINLLFQCNKSIFYLYALNHFKPQFYADTIVLE
jgi:hypothetical protein